MRIEIYQVDAFARHPFEGNPAAVCPLEKWLPDSLMQSIALENNLSETAFFVPEGEGFAIRWFTPLAEVDLCGHATLASAWVLFHRLDHESDTVRFTSRSGPLAGSRRGDLLELDFPAQPPRPCPVPDGLVDALGAQPLECLEFVDLLAVFDDPETVLRAAPDMAALSSLGYRGVIFSDDMGMHAARVVGALMERTQRCLEAGCDLVLVCQPRLLQHIKRLTLPEETN